MIKQDTKNAGKPESGASSDTKLQNTAVRVAALFTALAGAGMVVYGYAKSDPVAAGTGTSLVLGGLGVGGF